MKIDRWARWLAVLPGVLSCLFGYAADQAPAKAAAAQPAVVLSPVASEPLNCANSYLDQTKGDKAMGELTCARPAPSCPAGWDGGMSNGQLVCTPRPQPVIKCPSQTAVWKSGSSYYKRDWNEYGCAKNPEPPK